MRVGPARERETTVDLLLGLLPGLLGTPWAERAVRPARERETALAPLVVILRFLAAHWAATGMGPVGEKEASHTRFAGTSSIFLDVLRRLPGGMIGAHTRACPASNPALTRRGRSGYGSGLDASSVEPNCGLDASASSLEPSLDASRPERIWI